MSYASVDRTHDEDDEDTSLYIKWIAAKNELTDQKIRESQAQTELDILDDSVAPPPPSRMAKKVRVTAWEKYADLSSREIIEDAEKMHDRLFKATTFSRNVKGTVKKTIRDSTVALDVALQVLIERNTATEIKRLEALNADLRKEVSALRAEIDTLKKDSEAEKSLESPHLLVPFLFPSSPRGMK